MTPLCEFVWRNRYRNEDPGEAESGIEDTWRRVAQAVAAIEREPEVWRQRFASLLQGFRFLPAGRILANAGTLHRGTLFNCFVMGRIEDSIEGIFEALKEGALTMQQGGGVGYDFSTLRPSGSRARTTGMIASGPVSFMHVWDAMCATLVSTGARRGAMMATLRCDHPDIEAFIDAKRTPGSLRHFNLSVLVTDEFMAAVKADASWALVFPDGTLEDACDADCVKRAWSGSTVAVRCRVHKRVRARDLWQRLCASAFDCGDPGVLFIDRINAVNNLSWCETLSATNPCGEEPLPPYGACNLGSVNLAAFVSEPFTARARFDYEGIRQCTGVAVRFLDNVIEISRFPLARQREQVHRSRRIGLGVTGLADALAMLRLRYDTPQARGAAGRVMRVIRDSAYASSVDLARERGAFPAFQATAYLGQPFIRTLPQDVREGIRQHGIRNSHLLALAPAGSISLLANNVSSGIEPIFAVEAFRTLLGRDGERHDLEITDAAYAAWRASHDGQAREVPDFFVSADEVSASDQLQMQAVLQPLVDGAIAKTIALGRECAGEDLAPVLQAAFDLGLKGCTVFRTGSRTSVLRARQRIEDEEPAVEAEPCCHAHLRG